MFCRNAAKIALFSLLIFALFANGVVLAGGGCHGGKCGNHAEGERRGPGERTVGGGTDSKRHNLNVHEKGHKAGTFERQKSGGVTPAMKAQHQNNAQWASHTEAKALANMQSGQHLVMVGQKPPCNRCQGAIRSAVARTGGKVTYSHRSGQYSVHNTWEKLDNGTIQRTTSRFDSLTNTRNESVSIYNGTRWVTPPTPTAPAGIKIGSISAASGGKGK